jgi:hypothetical protein
LEQYLSGVNQDGPDEFDDDEDQEEGDEAVSLSGLTPIIPQYRETFFFLVQLSAEK